MQINEENFKIVPEMSPINYFSEYASVGCVIVVGVALLYMCLRKCHSAREQNVKDEIALDIKFESKIYLERPVFGSVWIGQLRTHKVAVKIRKLNEKRPWINEEKIFRVSLL